MGAWGPALFSDDLACEVRGDYRELIEDGVADGEATWRVVESHAAALADPDDGPVVWLALAVTQSKIGRLDPAVAERAVQVIDRDEGMARWREQGPALEARRRAALARTRDQLTGPQPPRRRLRPPWRHVTSLRPGDVLSYRTRAGDCLLLRVPRIEESRPGVAPILVLLDFAGPAVPTIAKVAAIPDKAGPRSGYAALTGPGGKTRFHVGVYRRKDPDYPAAGFARVGAIGPRPGDATVIAGMYASWATFGPDVLDAWMETEPLQPAKRRWRGG